MKNILRITLFMAAWLFAGSLLLACQPGGPETALLQGGVTIGPISPVEIPGQTQPVSPEIFAARKIVIYDESGRDLVREVSITQIDQGATGYYTVQLAPGTYVVDIKHTGIDSSHNVPQKITLSADETVTLDIDIDTGIR